MKDTTDNILVIKLGALGDFIYGLGPMAAIRAHHPDAKITLLTTAPFAEMGQDCGYFDEILVDSRPKLFDLGGWLALRKALNDARITRVYDLQNNDRTQIYLRLFSKKPEWVGTAKGASHRNADPTRKTRHAFYGHQATLGIGGIENVELDPLLWMDRDVSHYQLKQPYVLLVPGCSVQHPEKRWPVEYFRAILAKLIPQGYLPVILGSKDDKPVVDQVIRGMEDTVVNLTAKTTLAEIPALARGAVAAIGNDTGPMHICAVSGCPVIMLYCNQTSTIAQHGPPKDHDVYALEAMDLKDISAAQVWAEFQKAVGAISARKAGSGT